MKYCLGSLVYLSRYSIALDLDATAIGIVVLLCLRVLSPTEIYKIQKLKVERVMCVVVVWARLSYICIAKLRMGPT
jgi:hypothetical protein